MENCAETAEARIMEAAIPSIQKLCRGKWYNLEYPDRASEACCIFLEDLRTMPLNTGHFLEECRADLDAKMREINRRTPSRRFHHQSPDSFFSRKNGQFFDGHGLFASSLTDFSIAEVKEFLRSLPVLDRRIVLHLLKGLDGREISD